MVVVVVAVVVAATMEVVVEVVMVVVVAVATAGTRGMKGERVRGKERERKSVMRERVEGGPGCWRTYAMHALQ